MTLPALMHGVGSIGPFAARAFMPAFVTALLLRIAQEGYLQSVGMLQNVQQVPSWFTEDLTLLVLGILSFLELAADKSASARELLDRAMVWVRGGMAMATYFGLLSVTDAAVAEDVINQADTSGTLTAVIIGLGTVAVGWARSDLLASFREADPDDDTALQKLWSWGEDLWASFGVVLLIVVPIAMVVLTVFVSAVIMLVRWRLQRKEDAQRKPCPNCETPNYGCALACPKCNQHFDSPRDVGFLGITTDKPADRETLPYRLVTKGRCGKCATRLKKNRPDQECPECGRVAFPSRAFLDGYLRKLGQRVPGVLIITGLLSLIPILGLIPAVIVYRVKLIAPLKRYMPWHRGLAMRWLVRLIFVGLVALQLVPGVGGFAVPAMALLSFAAYRSAFIAQVGEVQATEPTTQPLPAS